MLVAVTDPYRIQSVAANEHQKTRAAVIQFVLASCIGTEFGIRRGVGWGGNECSKRIPRVNSIRHTMCDIYQGCHMSGREWR